MFESTSVIVPSFTGVIYPLESGLKQDETRSVVTKVEKKMVVPSWVIVTDFGSDHMHWSKAELQLARFFV